MVELVDEELRVRVVADRDEDAVDALLPGLVGLHVAEPDGFDLAVAEDLVDHGVRDELDLGVRAGAIEHDLRRPEVVAAMDDRHLRREAGEERGLLHRGVAAADDDQFLLAEERAVTGRAGRHAAPLVLRLAGQPEPAGARAGRDDHRAGLVFLVLDPDAEGALGEVDPRHVVRDEFGAEALRLPAELGHHLGPHHAVGVARIVLDIARDHQLAAPVEALDHERGEVRPRGVEGRGVPGGAAADDDQVTCVSH